MTTWTEYGLRVNCVLNGCEPPHEDDGDILPRGDVRPMTARVNGHAVTVVKRTWTATDWTSVITPGDGRTKDAAHPEG